MTAAMALSIINGFDLDTTARFVTCAGTMTCLKKEVMCAAMRMFLIISTELV